MAQEIDREAQSQHDYVINKWRQDEDRRKDKSEAAEKGLKDFIAAAMKTDGNKKTIGAEGLRCMEAGERGEDPVKAAQKGEHKFGGTVTEEDFTGINEKQPWLRE
jgi:hypothetical protein